MTKIYSQCLVVIFTHLHDQYSGLWLLLIHPSVGLICNVVWLHVLSTLRSRPTYVAHISFLLCVPQCPTLLFPAYF